MRLSCGLLALVLTATTIRAADRYVAPSGDDTANTCLVAAAPCRTLGAAHAAAGGGDTINVAAGVYRESLRISGPTPLTFLGGWDAGFTVRDPRANRTALRGGPVSINFISGTDRVFTLAALGSDLNVSIDGFTLERSRGFTCLGSLGCSVGSGASQSQAGGALGGVANAAVLTLAVSNTIVARNVPPRFTYGGGGIAVLAENGGRVDATLTSVVVDRNRAPRARLGGGGILAYVAESIGQPGATIDLTLTNTMVTRNRTDGDHGGGGLLIMSRDTLLRVVNSTIKGNMSRQRADRPPVAGGGGVRLRAFSSFGPASAIADLTNTILWGNSVGANGVGKDFYVELVGATLNADHTDLGEITVVDGTFNDGGGNLQVPPGLTLDLHLASTSPLIDAGTCVGAPATDLDGDPRPSGSTCDIGTDEFVP